MRAILIALLPLAAACGAPQTAECPPCEVVATGDAAAAVDAAASAQEPATQPAAHDNLNATVWYQTSIENVGLSIGMWRAAASALDVALADPTWTAAPEEQAGDFGELPPAAIVDLDETLIDNSAYQAWLITSGEAYSGTTWGDWCDDADAYAVPGALEFANRAAELGVTLFFVTNRNGACEAATVQNLTALGFTATPELVVTRDESDAGSAKGARRAAIAAEYRILILAGDNFGDFLDDYNGTPEARAARAAPYEGFWGTRWFVLANPTYGSWYDAVTPVEGNDHQQAVDSLRVWQP